MNKANPFWRYWFFLLVIVPGLVLLYFWLIGNRPPDSTQILPLPTSFAPAGTSQTITITSTAPTSAITLTAGDPEAAPPRCWWGREITLNGNTIVCEPSYRFVVVKVKVAPPTAFDQVSWQVITGASANTGSASSPLKVFRSAPTSGGKIKVEEQPLPPLSPSPEHSAAYLLFKLNEPVFPFFLQAKIGQQNLAWQFAY